MSQPGQEKMNLDEAETDSEEGKQKQNLEVGNLKQQAGPTVRETVREKDNERRSSREGTC